MGCPICEKPADKLCTACNSISYCSTDHQRDHWRVHKKHCSPFKIIEDEDNHGRIKHWIATRDLKPGEVIVEEMPLIHFPQEDVQLVDRDGYPYYCLTCGLNVTYMKIKCTTCGWPVCSRQCEMHEIHAKNECKVFSVDEGGKFKRYRITEALNVLTMTRAATIKLQFPKLWTQLMDMVDWDSKEAAGYAQNIPNIPIGYPVGGLDAAEIEERMNDYKKIRYLCKVKGFYARELDVLEDENKRPFDGTRYRSAYYLFKHAATLTHSCVPNAMWRVGTFPDFKLRLRAATAIPKGQILTVSLTTNLDTIPAVIRRNVDYYNIFDRPCACPRCIDPSECGSFVSAVTCKKCRDECLQIHINNKLNEAKILEENRDNDEGDRQEKEKERKAKEERDRKAKEEKEKKEREARETIEKNGKETKNIEKPNNEEKTDQNIETKPPAESAAPIEPPAPPPAPEDGYDETSHGYFLPIDPLDVSRKSLWRCNRCSATVPLSNFLPKLEKIREQNLKLSLSKITWEMAQALYDVIKQYRGKVLHPNHWMIQWPMKILMYRIGPQRLVKNPSKDGKTTGISLQEVEDFLKDTRHLLGILDKIEPGMTPFRAMMQNVAASTIQTWVMERSYPKTMEPDQLTPIMEKVDLCLEFQKEAMTYYKYDLPELGHKLCWEAHALKAKIEKTMEFKNVLIKRCLEPPEPEPENDDEESAENGESETEAETTSSEHKTADGGGSLNESSVSAEIQENGSS